LTVDESWCSVVAPNVTPLAVIAAAELVMPLSQIADTHTTASAGASASDEMPVHEQAVPSLRSSPEVATSCNASPAAGAVSSGVTPMICVVPVLVVTAGQVIAPPVTRVSRRIT